MSDNGNGHISTNIEWRQLKKFIDDLSTPAMLNYFEYWESYWIWVNYQGKTLECTISKDGPDVAEFETNYKPLSQKKVASDGTEVKATSNKVALSVENAINVQNYDLFTAPLSATSNIANDYILESIDFTFSTEELKTITISTSNNQILWGGALEKTPYNLGYNTKAKSISLVFDQSFKANDNIRIDISQTSNSCLANCIVKIKRGSDILVGGAVLGSGNSVIGTTFDFNLEVSKGNITGHSEFSALGERDSVAVEATGSDIWKGSSIYIPIPALSGEQLSVASSSVNDSLSGNGAKAISIHYLDSNGDEYSESITLSGTTAADTLASNIRFVQSIHVTSVESNTTAVGDITIFRKGEPTRIYCSIKAGGNMSLSSLRMVPKNKIFYLEEWSASAIGKQPVSVRIRTTDHHGEVYNGTNPVFLFKDICLLDNTTYNKKFAKPIKVPSFSMIKVTAWTTQTGASVATSYGGTLVSI